MKKSLIVILVCASVLISSSAFGGALVNAIKERSSIAVTTGAGFTANKVALVKNVFYLYEAGGNWMLGAHYGGSDFDATTVNELDYVLYGGFLVRKIPNAFGKDVGMLIKLELLSEKAGGSGYDVGSILGLGIYKAIDPQISLFGGIDYSTIPFEAEQPNVKLVEPVENKDVTQWGIHLGLNFHLAKQEAKGN